jgi:hypothetical protein
MPKRKRTITAGQTLSKLPEYFDHVGLNHEKNESYREWLKRFYEWDEALHEYYGIGCTYGETYPPKGKCYSITFDNGQTITITVSPDGNIVERSYTDRGSVHFRQVLKLIQGWEKTVKQVQAGGLRNPELSSIYAQWKTSGYDPVVKRKLKKEYLQSCSGEYNAEGRFVRYMRRRRKGDKSLNHV